MLGVLWVLAASCATMFKLRLESEEIRYGLLARRAIAYADIVELERDSTGKDAVFYVHLRSGRRKRLGSNFACEKYLIDEIRRRSDCKTTRTRLGRREP